MSDSEEHSSAHDVSAQRNNKDEETDSGSNYSASDSSRAQSSLQEASSNRGRSRKRKVKETSTTSVSRVKRLRASYSENYRKLFNNTLENIVSRELPIESSLPSSQLGITLWSPEEKESLFVGLARRGRHDIKAIASDIGSKSESEVTVFMDKLQYATNEEQIYELVPKKLLKTYDIESAHEISGKCCEHLDLAAQALSILQQREEEKSERRKHGDISLLTNRIAKRVDRRLRTGELGEEEVTKTLPAAVLLNLKTFLELSRRVFMNSSVLENNWRTYMERVKAPSIMYTAFSDFHNLALSVTQRLVQSSLFFAMSRLKAVDAAGNYILGRHVKRIDVLAALDTLSMQRNSTRTWTGTARKCKLRVYENVRRRQRSGKRYRYDEVEEILSSKRSRSRGRSVSRVTDTSNVPASEQSETTESSSADETEDSNSSISLSHEEGEPSSLSSGDGDHPSLRQKQSRKQQALEQAQDSYAETLDQRASRAEEHRLWELLGEDPAAQMEEDIQMPKIPAGDRKSKDDLVDWKDWVDYASEWENFETPVPASSFAENRRLGRTASPAAGLTDSDTEDDELGKEGSSRQASTAGERISGASVRGDSTDSHGDDGNIEFSTPSPKAAGRGLHDKYDEEMDESSDQSIVDDEERRERIDLDREQAPQERSEDTGMEQEVEDTEDDESDSLDE